MKNRTILALLLVASFAIALLFSTFHSARAESPAQPGPDTVLKTLRKGHPRLIMLESDLERVQKMIRDHSDAKEYANDVRRDAERTLGAKPVEYIVVGPRLLSQSRRCLDRVYTLSLIYRLSGEKRFAERALVELKAAAAFPDWNPSHFLDTAEMTHAFAIGYDWLYDFLSPEDRRLVKNAIVEKGLKPAMNVYEKDGWWARSLHNWNQVCNGGIGIGALAIADEEPELCGKILSAAIRSIPRAMNSFAPEGAWGEGPGYWNYASRYAVYLFAALDSALGTDFGLSEMTGFPDAGLFRIYFSGPIGKTFNYADAGEGSGSAAQMFWMARKYNKPIYAWHQRQCVRRAGPHDLIWFDPRGEGPVANKVPLDRHFKGADVIFLRSKWEDRNAIFVGFKGGDNRVNHSHLDLGSFVFDALGERWAVDLGGDDYNLPGYFGSKRWTYYRLRTDGQNTLVINDSNQDPRAPAPIIGFGSSPENGWAVADMTKAYGDVKGKVLRGMALLDRAHILVQDEITSDTPVDVLWGMHTPAKVDLDGATAVLSQGDARVLARILEPAGARFEVISANPPRPQRQNPNVRKLVVRLPGKVKLLRLAVLLSPYEQSSPKPQFSPRIQPLTMWLPRDR